jgi:ABC-type Na+ efflux pump permease subunit
MYNMLQVARAEISYHTQYWAFYIFSLGMPLVFAAFGAFPRIQNVASQTPLASVETVFNMDTSITVATGYVDKGYFITEMPDDLIAQLHAYPNEEMARAALTKGYIKSYYVIATDYITSGEVTQYSLNPQLIADTDIAMSRLLEQNLYRHLPNPKIATRLSNPVTVINHGPPPPLVSFIPTDIDLSRLASASLIIGLFTYLINASGALLVRALQREVNMRVLEILITSTSAAQFIGGKLLGLSALALWQAALSLIAGMLVYGYNPDGSGPAALSWLVLLKTLPYLFLGLAAFCGMVMSMAAVWPNSRETGMLLWIAWLIAMAPLLGVLFMLPNMNSWLTVGLSLFPPSAALLMPFRLLLTQVPLWQWLTGLLGLSLWASFTIGLSIRLFRAGKLLTGQPITLHALREAMS